MGRHELSPFLIFFSDLEVLQGIKSLQKTLVLKKSLKLGDGV